MKTTTKYAVLIVLCLASYGGTRSAKDIAAFTGIPTTTIVQVASKLRQARLIDSTRGHDGGYYLASTVGGISLLDILEAMEKREGVAARIRFERPSSSRSLGCDPVSERGAERLACAVHALAIVDSHMDEVLREATLDKLVFGRGEPVSLEDFSASSATPDSHAACIPDLPKPSKEEGRSSRSPASVARDGTKMAGTVVGELGGEVRGR